MIALDKISQIYDAYTTSTDNVEVISSNLNISKIEVTEVIDVVTEVLIFKTRLAPSERLAIVKETLDSKYTVLLERLQHLRRQDLQDETICLLLNITPEYLNLIK